ncbi:MAG: hypothetical protein ACMUIU_08745 [bacterium]
MPLTKEEKDYIVNQVVDILKAPNKKILISELRKKVLSKEDNAGEGEKGQLDDAVYAVLQAIEELYG